ncbi:hypothetical protein MAR_021883 [Mya arenaria]|uniref:Ig-like domain-containing protein n=1 Tax=Mya arenaria TaxID=6604 RepID=A0ABY7EDP2_MYAAR|nr:hypothetical protein MAR_021883 [Mya arenaria]
MMCMTLDHRRLLRGPLKKKPREYEEVDIVKDGTTEVKTDKVKLPSNVQEPPPRAPHSYEEVELPGPEDCTTDDMIIGSPSSISLSVCAMLGIYVCAKVDGWGGGLYIRLVVGSKVDVRSMGQYKRPSVCSKSVCNEVDGWSWSQFTCPPVCAKMGGASINVCLSACLCQCGFVELERAWSVIPCDDGSGTGTPPVSSHNEFGELTLFQPAFVGGNVTFRLTPSVPITAVTWQCLIPGNPVIQNFNTDEVAVRKVGETFLLVIKDVDKSLNGTYVFATFLHHENISLVAELNLREALGCGELNLLSDEPFVVGDVVRFGYFPSPEVIRGNYAMEMIKSTNLLKIPTPLNRLKLQLEGNEYKAVLLNVSMADSGVYRIQCVDGFSTNFSNPIMLIIEVPPEDPPKLQSTSVLKGETIDITCTSPVARPAPQLEIIHHRVFTCRTRYLCACAKKWLSPAVLLLLTMCAHCTGKKPTVYIKETRPVPHYNIVYLNCLSVGYPDSNITWEMVDPLNGNTVEVLDMCDTPTCTLKIVSSSIDLVYNCVAQNEFGRANKTTRIVVSQENDGNIEDVASKHAFPVWIVATVVASVVFGFLVILLIYCCVKRRNRTGTAQVQHEDNQLQPPYTNSIIEGEENTYNEVDDERVAMQQLPSTYGSETGSEYIRHKRDTTSNQYDTIQETTYMSRNVSMSETPCPQLPKSPEGSSSQPRTSEDYLHVVYQPMSPVQGK